MADGWRLNCARAAAECWGGRVRAAICHLPSADDTCLPGSMTERILPFRVFSGGTGAAVRGE
jgi:hypothetical protein